MAYRTKTTDSYEHAYILGNTHAMHGYPKTYRSGWNQTHKDNYDRGYQAWQEDGE